MSDYQAEHDELEPPDFTQYRSPAERAEAAEAYALQMRQEVDRELLQGHGRPYNAAEESPGRSPGEEGVRAFEERIRTRGGTREAASCEVINRLVHAAVKGDQRVLIPADWTARAAAEAAER